MIPPMVSRGLNLRPVKQVILRAGKSRRAGQVFQRLSGASGIFESIDEAREAVRRHRADTCGHLDGNLIGSNFTLSSTIRMSDYPVLFWLQEAIRTEKLSVFDFGGGVGQTYVNFSHLLPEDRLERWIVQDLPDVISQASTRFFLDGVPPRLVFTDRMAAGSTCNVALAAGALHYWEGSMSAFLDAMGTRPAHFMVNRSPMRARGKAFFTVQQGRDWAVPCQVRSVEQVTAEMEAEGYTLVDSWTDLEKSLNLPLFPDYSCPYRGLYYQRLEDS
ncbi:methyltransferase, TIGR04325 family [Luteolibacter arcticus]|uniref:Methyltransferase, TIGR04325 family n=1 Tax=Luteolibacter arcticus TaxID=1581411 RepID=A0ABT3GP14_9BACT|nr:methyltransferase, TIGR04325 family [Luteolibacter arcticus]MCW1925270.1 methyltransferase, TIGR04325 family [Luteolibacter arcticus]